MSVLLAARRIAAIFASVGAFLAGAFRAGAAAVVGREGAGVPPAGPAWPRNREHAEAATTSGATRIRRAVSWWDIEKPPRENTSRWIGVGRLPYRTTQRRKTHGSRQHGRRRRLTRRRTLFPIT